MRPSQICLQLLIALCLLLIGAPSFAAQGGAGKRISPKIIAGVERGEPVEALILLDDTAEQEAEITSSRHRSQGKPETVDEYNLRMNDRAARLNALKDQIKSDIIDPDFEILREYLVLPVLHVRIRSSQALDQLIRHGKALVIDENLRNEPALVESLPLISQPPVWNKGSGYGGAGTTVAILDSGVDYTHAAFGSCSAPGGACKVSSAQDFAPQDYALDDADRHGTNLAGIVLGMAPAAKIAALDVFSSDGGAYISDIIAAIDWCILNRANYNIVAINLSLGTGRYFSAEPPIDVWGQSIQQAVNAGIIVVAASGNEAYTDSLIVPAAYSNVVSVGAVYDANGGSYFWGTCADLSSSADKVPCFSNNASFLTMLAPGAEITAAGVSMAGTSQAAPHVAGAAAVLRAAFPGESVAETVDRLKRGTMVTDTRNGVIKPRLNLVAATSNGIFQLTTSVSPVGGGSVSPEAGLFNPGTEVVLTASPSTGFVFNGWVGDCGAYETNSTCTLVMNANKDVTANFVMTTTEPIPLSNGLVVSTLSGSAGSFNKFYIDVPLYAKNLTVQSFHGTGDADLYVSRDSPPTTTNYDCASFASGNYETCSFNYPSSGRYYISLYGYTQYSGVSLQASYATDLDGDGVPDSSDNCPNIANPDQVDANGNGKGDVCDESFPLTDNTEFVRQTYRDFLNREPDAAGLTYWAGQLNSGVIDHSELVEQYLLSPEFQGKVAPVARLYFAYFNRLPDYAGLMYWVNEYGSGNRTLNNISDFFASSPEFQQTYGSLSNAQFVTLVYQNVLDRDPEPDGFAFWTSELDLGHRTRGQVMTGFSESVEYQSLMAHPVYVTMTYIGLLRRAPELDGYNYWVGIMDQGATGLALIDGFLYSYEYEGRFNGTWVIAGLEILGPTNVDESKSATYSARATWADGRTSLLTPVWSDNSEYASIGPDGILSTFAVTSDQYVTLSASYTSGGVMRSDTHNVTIKNAPPTLAGLVINGPTSVYENSSASYTTTASWSDGTYTTVTPVWSENSAYASIDSYGTLTTTSVSSNQVVTIAASYTVGQTTLSDTHTVTIENYDPYSWVPELVVGVSQNLFINAYATNEYKFTATVSRPYLVSLTNTKSDLSYDLTASYSDYPDTWIRYCDNYQYSGPNNEACVTPTSLVQGQTYFLFVDEWDYVAGSFTLRIDPQ